MPVATVSSMTGFARTTVDVSGCSWIWEAKSVNARGLDVRIRLPQGFDIYENKARIAVGKKFKRGSISLSLSLYRGDRKETLRINQELLQHVLEVQKSLKGKVSDDLPRLDALLQLRGLIEVTDGFEPEAEELWSSELDRSLDLVLDSLMESRQQEGERLSLFVSRLINNIEEVCKNASNLEATQPIEIKTKLAAQVEALLSDVQSIPDERIAHEVTLLTIKADVREELDRLTAHVEAARDLLVVKGPIGRKLDFLCQEFNRESNTLCSKSSDLKLTNMGLELKTLVDQMREQVSNIE